MTRCPLPSCEQDVPKGCVVCVDHYFALEPARARFLTGMKVRLDRETDPALRAHLAEQLDSYIRIAIRDLNEEATRWVRREKRENQNVS